MISGIESTENKKGDWVQIAYYLDQDTPRQKVYLVQSKIGDEIEMRYFYVSETANNKEAAYARYYEREKQVVRRM